MSSRRSLFTLFRTLSFYLAQSDFPFLAPRTYASPLRVLVLALVAIEAIDNDLVLSALAQGSVATLQRHLIAAAL